ncbi:MULTISPECIES: bifunctional diguanylate cyclase/phosphodiesterase [unclassified Cyanobium]|uniref:putative bifunctional diguanylate cyclase/phosphodiesterase n=1 Tax=unclassified Cyanobium TaxID=2627006 RepID=UPI0020CB763A|nr:MULTISPECIES: GGDEF domain-containing phosphodiesterase [unclassified Cyanobium]MCP9859203.1 EAL domain-containing protein [Cyanobium sp. Cruz-8H5]MCP9866404.1 EAL domain-containing protein [Cyanobium sp. Cruz-8D1]
MEASVPSPWFSTPSEQGLIPCVDSVGDALRFAADLGSDDLVVLDLASGRHIDCNRSAHERLGYDRDHFLTLNPAAIQADGDQVSDLVADQLRLMRQQPRGGFATRLRARSGACRDVSVSYQVLELRGRLVALVSHRDRTDLDTALRESSRLGSLLQEAERLTHVGSWELHHRSGELLWSNEVYSIFNTTPGQTVPSYEVFLSRVHPEDRFLVEATFQDSLCSGRPYRIEHRLLLGDGLIKVVLERGRTTLDENGQPLSTVGTVQDISEQHEIQQRLERIAFVDPLTRLPNKAATIRQLARLLRTAGKEHSIALINLDLDNFQSINNSLGHEIGNQVLQASGTCLRHLMRQDDWLARVGSDEFILLRPMALADRGQALQWAEEIRRTLGNTPGMGTGLAVQPSASLGVALAPDHGQDPDTLLRCANTALMEAKQHGKNQLRVYSPEISLQLRERLELELSLGRAIDREQLQLVYQPQIDRGGRRIAGAEALLRWRDQNGRMVSPNVFIPLAERTGQIHSIGLWVIEEACRQLHAWHSQGLRLGKLAINISALQLGAEHPSLAELLAGALKRYDLVPENLELEITETALLNDPARASEQLRQLANSGFSLAIDDFGTGYSSLAMLHSLPLDKLKIDRFFVDRLGHDDADLAIVKATIVMAKELGLMTLAEGVETREQLQMLQNLGCDQFQGHLLGRPMDTDAFGSLLQGVAAA